MTTPDHSSVGSNPRPGGVSKRFLVGLIAVFAVGTIAAGMFLRSTVQTRGGDPLTGDERAPLVERGEGESKRLVHPALGFGFAHPGPSYERSLEAEERFADQFPDDSTVFFVYAELETGNLLYVSLSKRTGIDAEGFENMVDTVTEVFSQQASNRLGENVSVDTAERVVDADRGTATVHNVLEGGAGHVRIGALRSTLGTGQEYVVLLTGVSLQSDALAEVISSLRPR